MGDKIIDSRPGKRTQMSSWMVVGIGVLLVLFVVGMAGFAFGFVSLKGFVKKTTTPPEQPQIVQSPLPADKKVEGKIVDFVTESPVENAAISGGLEAVTSNSDGTFTLLLKAGSETPITVIKDGYKSKTVTAENASQVTLTPLGRVVFISNRDGKRSIYSANYDGTEDRQLIPRSGDTEDFSVTISPRERYVAFLSTRTNRKSKYGSLDPSLYLMRTDGTDLQKISDFYDISSIKWSPDGSYLAWTGREKIDDNGSKLAIRNIVTGATVYNGDGRGGVSDYSYKNDDSKVAFSMYSNASASQSGIFVADGDGKNAKKISDTTNTPTFNNDGNVEFVSYDNGQKYYAWFSNTGEVKEISKNPNDDKIRFGTKSPNGNLIAFIDTRDGKSNVFVSKLDKSEEKKLTSVDAASGNVRWTQNGSYITFSINKTGETSRYIVAVSGQGKEKKIIDEYTEDYGRMY